MLPDVTQYTNAKNKTGNYIIKLPLLQINIVRGWAEDRGQLNAVTNATRYQSFIALVSEENW